MNETDITDSPDLKIRSAVRRISPVLMFQILLCVIAGLSAAVLKMIGGDAYEYTRRAYEENANNSIVTELDRSNSDFIRAEKNDYKKR